MKETIKEVDSMKRFGLWVWMAFVIAGICSCSSAKMDVKSLDSEWNITEMNGKRLDPAKTRQFLAFDISRQTLSGNAGCNRISGRIIYNPAQKNIIRFGQVIVTRMACLNMTYEDELLKTLEKVVRFEMEKKSPLKVALYGTDNSKLLVIEKR
jgi:heat shock protein HslJ